MRACVMRDWQVHVRHVAHVVTVLARAAAPAIGASCTVFSVMVVCSGILVPHALGSIVRFVANDSGTLREMSMCFAGWLVGAATIIGAVRAMRDPSRFGYVNQLDQEIVNRLMRRSGVTILRG